MRAIGIIPARYESTRFPGKVLVNILGKPMVYWVAEGLRESRYLDEVVIASDSDKVLAAAKAAGIGAMKTSPQHRCGSDRVWEAAAEFDAEIIVNIQGDQPTITAAMVDNCIEPLINMNQVDVATLKSRISSNQELFDPNIVKVVTDANDFALYFSRSPIPHPGKDDIDTENSVFYKHLGIYAYRRSALEKFCSLPQSVLEKTEKLEQLRGLAAGLKYYVSECQFASIDVNTRGDIELAEEILLKRKKGNK